MHILLSIPSKTNALFSHGHLCAHLRQLLSLATGLDVNRTAIVGAKQNVDTSPLLYHNTSCEFHCKDARAMKTIVGDLTLNAVITNVPWGVQTGKNVDLQAIYEIVLRTAWYCLKPGGRFVMLVLRVRLFFKCYR